MTEPTQPIDVTSDGVRLSVTLFDGRIIAVPLSWYPRLLTATPEQLANWKPCAAGAGIHWPDLDEDVEIEAVLRGRKAVGVA